LYTHPRFVGGHLRRALAEVRLQDDWHPRHLSYILNVVAAFLAQLEKLEVLLLVGETSLDSLRDGHLGVGARSVQGSGVGRGACWRSRHALGRALSQRRPGHCLGHVRRVVLVVVEQSVDVVSRDRAGLSLFAGRLLTLLLSALRLLRLPSRHHRVGHPLRGSSLGALILR